MQKTAVRPIIPMTAISYSGKESEESTKSCCEHLSKIKLHYRV